MTPMFDEKIIRNVMLLTNNLNNQAMCLSTLFQSIEEYIALVELFFPCCTIYYLYYNIILFCIIYNIYGDSVLVERQEQFQ